MLRLDLSRAAVLLGPLLVLGFVAGAMRAFARRPGVPPRRQRILEIAWVLLLLAGALRALALRAEAPSRRRDTLQASWVLLLLAGVPLWLVLAAVLGIW